MVKDEVLPIDIDVIRSLKGFERSEAIRKYNEWRTRQRKQERKEMERLRQKIYVIRCKYKKGGKDESVSKMQVCNER